MSLVAGVVEAGCRIVVMGVKIMRSPLPRYFSSAIAN